MSSDERKVVLNRKMRSFTQTQTNSNEVKLFRDSAGSLLREFGDKSPVLSMMNGNNDDGYYLQENEVIYQQNESNSLSQDEPE